MGEYVAACLAGVFSVCDGIALVVVRGKLFETLSAGAMLSVSLPEAELGPLLGDELSIAAVNAPSLCVAAGPTAAIEALERKLARLEVNATRVHISVAAHSRMLEPILPEFERFCRTIRLTAPKVPFISNVTGTWITDAEATDPKYWVRHLRNPVRFSQGVAALGGGGERVLVEVGPGRTLSSLARQQAKPPIAVPSLRHPQEQAHDVSFLLQTLGRVWAEGAPVDFARLHGEGRGRVPLPTYSFDRARYWIEAGTPAAPAPARAKRTLAKSPDLDAWFFGPAWKLSVVPPTVPPRGPWLVFCDGAGIADRLSARVRGTPLIRVTRGETFRKVAEDHFVIRPEAREDYEAVLEELERRTLFPAEIIYLWPLDLGRGRRLDAIFGKGRRRAGGDYDEAERLCFTALLSLAQAVGPTERPVRLSIVSTGLHGWKTERPAEPDKALLLGPMRVIPREFPNVSTRSVDLRFSDAAELELAASRLFDELAAPSRDAVVALRGLQRWTQTFEPMPLGPARRDHSPVRQGGTYVISGGLGGIGLELGLHLAKTAKAKLVLVGRAGLPDRATWPELRAAGGLVAERLEKIGAIEAAGGEVLALAGDVTSRLDMERVAAAARRRFGRVHGVIHAAGMLDDGLISLKTHEAALRVIAAKARGALVLDEIFGRESLDLFVVFSSVSSVLGLEGQIDYTAANAFLDAFAEAKAQDGAALSVSIGWNAWQEVGMAMAFAGRSTGAPARNAGPWIERVAAESAAETLLVTSFSRGKQWMLGEHVVRGGEALIPGTGYLELARAAFARKARPGTIEIRDLTFFAPFVVKLNETRDLHVRLSTLNPRGADVTFYSHAANEPHAAGRVELVDRPAPPRVDIAALLRRCSAKEKIVGGFMDQAFMEFGPRWKNVERVCFGVDEAVISLSLPESLASDLADFPLHPGLLDMATGGAQLLIEGFDCNEDFYVPFSYARVTAYDALAPRLHSHVRHRRSDGKDFAVFDATIYDDEGRLLVDISGFTMRRVPRTFTVGASDARAPVATDAGAHGGRDFGASKLGAALKLGMSSAEGMEAFDRIMAARASGHVIASSVDLREWLAFVDEQARPAASPSDGDAIAEGTSSHAFARPSIATEFVSPTNDLERALAGMWCEVLGLREIGIHDDFFELGGQSLVALRLFSKIRKKYGVDLPLSTLFEAPTIKQCAEVVAAEAGVSLLEESASDRLGVNGHIDRASVGEARPASEVPEIGRWFSRAVWREDIVGATADPERRTWLVFVDQAGVLNAIAERLRAKGHRVITVREGDTYHKRGADDYQVFPEGGSEGYERLLRDVWAGGVAPTRILHGWLVTDRETFRRGSNFLHRNLELGFTSLLLLAQGLAKQARSNSIHLITIATGMQRVGREKGRYPEKAAALGPALVMPKELSGITTSVVDIALPTGERTGWLRKAPGAASVAPVEVLETLEAEVLAAPRAEIVALRGRSRFVLGAEAVALEASLRAGFKDRGVYLITNGFAGSGPSIAWHLAKRWRARLVLLDPSSRRGAQASDNVTSEVTSERARRVRALEELGAEVLVAAAQVMNVDRLREVVREAEERFGVVDGVIHTGGARRQGSLVDEQDAGVESVFAPRIYGTLALAEVFRAHRLDFLLLCSTATVLDAAAGQTGEVAASAFLDAFADTVRDSAIIALDWQPSSRTDISSDPLASGVTADDELTALERVLSSSPHASLVMSATALASVGRAIQTGAAGPRSAEAARPPRLANAAAALIDGRPEAAAAARLLHLVKMCAPAGTRQSPLFVVAGLLGNVLNLRRLAQIVGAERPVYGLQARGLFGGLKPHETFEEMARDYLTELRTVQSRGPFLLSGFSGGGITAYEMARQLIEEGETVQLIAFLDTPVLRRETLTLSDRLSIQAQNLRREGLAHVGRWMEGKRAYRRSVQTRGERLRAQHAGETHDFHSQVIEAAFYRALSRYAIRPLAVRATVFRPKLAPVYRLSGGRLLNRDRDHLYPDNGWGPFIEKLDIREVPGDHDSMVLEPNVRVLAAQVIEAIERAVVPAIAVAREAGDGVGR
jgi:thioesterase domain-containing protein/malonyl CoA-acyl carrier protein transacylase